jgi:hypothetical protein
MTFSAACKARIAAELGGTAKVVPFRINLDLELTLIVPVALMKFGADDRD